MKRKNDCEDNIINEVTNQQAAFFLKEREREKSIYDTHSDQHMYIQQNTEKTITSNKHTMAYKPPVTSTISQQTLSQTLHSHYYKGMMCRWQGDGKYSINPRRKPKGHSVNLLSLTYCTECFIKVPKH